MPTSKLRPPMNVVRDFYKSRGMDQQGDTLNAAMKTGQKDRSERLEARKTAMTGEMVSGGLCKSLG